MMYHNRPCHKLGKVSMWSSFKQSMMVWSPQQYIPSFKVKELSVLAKIICLSVFTIYGRDVAAILVM